LKISDKARTGGYLRLPKRLKLEWHAKVFNKPQNEGGTPLLQSADGKPIVLAQDEEVYVLKGDKKSGWVSIARMSNVPEGSYINLKKKDSVLLTEEKKGDFTAPAC